MLVYFVEHRLNVIVRRSRYELAKREARLHIVEGLLKALDIIDQVIDTIRRSRTAETAEANLIKKFEFTRTAGPGHPVHAVAPPGCAGAAQTGRRGKGTQGAHQVPQGAAALREAPAGGGRRGDQGHQGEICHAAQDDHPDRRKARRHHRHRGRPGRARRPAGARRHHPGLPAQRRQGVWLPRQGRDYQPRRRGPPDAPTHRARRHCGAGLQQGPGLVGSGGPAAACGQLLRVGPGQGRADRRHGRPVG